MTETGHSPGAREKGLQFIDFENPWKNALEEFRAEMRAGGPV